MAQRIEADDRPQQHRLAGAGPTDQPDHLAAEDVEVEMVVDDVVAELCAHIAQLQHDLPAVAMIDELAAFRRLGALHPLAGGFSSVLIRWPAAGGFSSVLIRWPAGR